MSKTSKYYKRLTGKKIEKLEVLNRKYKIKNKTNTQWNQHWTRTGYSKYIGPIGWGCRIHWLHLCTGVRPSQRVSWYDTKQSDGEVPVILVLWGMRSTPLLLSLPDPHWPGVVTPDRALSMGWIELTAYLC